MVPGFVRPTVMDPIRNVVPGRLRWPGFPGRGHRAAAAAVRAGRLRPDPPGGLEQATGDDIARRPAGRTVRSARLSVNVSRQHPMADVSDADAWARRQTRAALRSGAVANALMPPAGVMVSLATVMIVAGDNGGDEAELVGARRRAARSRCDRVPVTPDTVAAWCACSGNGHVSIGDGQRRSSAAGRAEQPGLIYVLAAGRLGTPSRYPRAALIAKRACSLPPTWATSVARGISSA